MQYAVLVITAGLALGGAVAAHGGQYLGPSSTTPPSASGSGSSTSTAPPSSGPTTPSAPSSPSSPTAGTGSAPVGGGGAPSRQATSRGMAMPDYDLTNWWYWWEFNKHRFLDLRARVHADPALGGGNRILGEAVRKVPLKPSVRQLAQEVTPALLETLRACSQRDMVSSCLVSLAKVGKVKDPVAAFRPFMRSPDQEMAETAVLALGIVGDPKGVELLREILADAPKGRVVTGDTQGVNYRKRSFAAYALGLLAYKGTDRTRRIVLASARQVLAETAGLANRDVPVAAINMVRLLNPDLGTPGGRLLAREAVTLLLQHLKGAGSSYLTQAHVPTALARILGRSGRIRPAVSVGIGAGPTPADEVAELRERVVTRLLATLELSGVHHLVKQSCLLALGELAAPDHPQVLKVVNRVLAGALGSDLQMRFFAYMLLGEMGGAKARASLTKALARKGGKRDKPWVGLALALEERRRIEQGARSEQALADLLVQVYRRESNPDRKAGLAMALGMIEAKQAVPELLTALEGSQVQSLKGYSAIALGMIGAREVIPALRKSLLASVRKPQLFQQLTVALGLLGDKTTVPELVRHLRQGPKTLAAQSSVAAALGYVGDSRAIAPLLKSLTTKEVASISRAFAAVALGLVGDKESRPWNAKIAAGINYRASVETLVGSANGVLDIL